MYEIFKDICNIKGWDFHYARKDYQNLFRNEEDLQKVFFFLDPVNEDVNFNSLNVISSVTYSGYFFVGMSSMLQQNYNDKYQNTIKGLKEMLKTLISDSLPCLELNINNWKCTEIVDTKDANLDGVVVNYNITIDE